MEEEKAKLMSRYSLTDEMLRRRCSQEHINEIAKFISVQEVGRHLPNIDIVALGDFEIDYSKESRRRTALLRLWVENNGDGATYDSLITAMITAEKIQQATDVCRMLRKKVDEEAATMKHNLPHQRVAASDDTPLNAESVFEEIKEVSKISYVFTIKLLKPFKECNETIKRVRSMGLKRNDARLLQFIGEYLKLVQPGEVWKGIVEALKDTAETLKKEELLELARRIEAAHCLNRPRHVVTEAKSAEQEYKKLKKSFAALVTSTRQAIDCIDPPLDVCAVVDRIIGLPPFGKARNKRFFMEYAGKLRESESTHVVFDRIRCHWDYLHPEIYESLVEEMPLTNVKPCQEDYQRKLDYFLDQTLLSDFCAIEGIDEEKDSDPPPKFTQCVSRHLWQPPPMFLRDVENFRREFANKCNLQSCAVTITSIKPHHSVLVTMLVPAETDLKVASDLDFIREHSIVQMIFNGVIVYSQDTSERGTSVDPIPRVKASRSAIALRYIFKSIFLRPLRNLLRLWKSHLTVAVENGYLDRVRELIASGEDPNPHTISTPLKEACSRGDIEIARALLEAGADPNLVTDNWTPSLEASRVGDREMIELLLEFGADPKAVNGDDWDDVMAASNNGHVDAVDCLLRHGAEPNKQNNVGWTGLHAAVHNGHEEVALRLVAAGANPHLQNMEYLSALRLAIMNNQESLVTAFLDRHPDLKRGLRGDPELDWPDKYEETDLLYACKINNLRVVKQILRKGADPNLANINGESPLLTAIGYGESEMVEELLKSGADPNMATVGEPPLSAAVGTGNSKIVADLLHFGAHPDVLTDEGTALALAVRCGDTKMVEDLLIAEADPNMASFVDQLPLHHARVIENTEIIELLKRHHADLSLETKLPKRTVAHYYGGLAMSAVSLLQKKSKIF